MNTTEKNARKIYQEYIEMMNDEKTKRELIAYQEFGDCFAIIEITTIGEKGNWVDYQVVRIDYFCNIDPIRTYSNLAEAKMALLALAYKSKPIIDLPF